MPVSLESRWAGGNVVGAAAWVRPARDPGTCENLEGSSTTGQGPGAGTQLSTSSQQLNTSKFHRRIIDTPALLVANGRFSFLASPRSPPWPAAFHGALSSLSCSIDCFQASVG